MTVVSLSPGRPIVNCQARFARRGACGRLVAAMVVASVIATPGDGFAAPPDRDGNTSFETNIRPILVERCDQCHSARSKKIRGGLVLEYKESWLKGGDRGPAIEPGKSDESPLIQAARYDDDLKMQQRQTLRP